MEKCKFMGSYVNASCPANTDLVDIIREAELDKHPTSFLANGRLVIRKLAIDAPADAQFTVNGVDFQMPTTGMFEIGLDVIDIISITFKSSVAVNIVYFY